MSYIAYRITQKILEEMELGNSDGTWSLSRGFKKGKRKGYLEQMQDSFLAYTGKHLHQERLSKILTILEREDIITVARHEGTKQARVYQLGTLNHYRYYDVNETVADVYAV